MPTADDVLEELNRAYIDSVQGADVARFEALLAPDFLCSNPDGTLVDRAAFLRQIARGSGISGLRAEDTKIRVMGEVAMFTSQLAGPARSPRCCATTAIGSAPMPVRLPRPASPRPTSW